MLLGAVLLKCCLKRHGQTSTCSRRRPLPVVTCFMEIMLVEMPRPSTLAMAVLKIAMSASLSSLHQGGHISRPWCHACHACQLLKAVTCRHGHTHH